MGGQTMTSVNRKQRVATDFLSAQTPVFKTDGFFVNIYYSIRKIYSGRHKEESKEFLENLLNKYTDGIILVVTHGGFIRMVYGIITKKPIKECLEEFPSGSIENTCIFEIEVLSNKSFKIIRQNCIRHLNLRKKEKSQIK